MIFYFSGAGNSEYVAIRLGESTGEKIYAIDDCLKNSRLEFRIETTERIGFVSPVYFFGLPSIVVDFLERVKFDMSGKHYIYQVITFGNFSGQCQWMMSKLLQRCHGVTLNSCFSVRMVDVWTPIFDLTDRQKCRRQAEAAEIMIGEIARQVLLRTDGDFDKRKITRLIAGVYYRSYRNKRQTKNFHSLDRCIGCGICARNCPVSAIEMNGQRPKWVKDRCVLCLRCLHHCPTFAIQYGNNTVNHGQYVHPKSSPQNDIRNLV